MATITETSKPSETASAPATQSPVSSGRDKPKFRIRVIYCEFLPANFCSRLRTIPIQYSEILNVDGDSTTFVPNWVSSAVLPRVWTVVTNFFQSWQIDESAIESIKAPFTGRPANEITRAIKDCLCFADSDSPTDMLSMGALKDLVRSSHEERSSLTVNVAFTGVLHSVVRAALESSPTLWREIYPARIDSGADVNSMVDELSVVFQRQIDRVLASPAPPAKNPPAPPVKETPNIPPRGPRLNPAFSRAMGVTPSTTASVLHRAADVSDVLTRVRNGHSFGAKKAFEGFPAQNDRFRWSTPTDDPNDYRKSALTFSPFSQAARNNDASFATAADDVVEHSSPYSGAPALPSLLRVVYSLSERFLVFLAVVLVLPAVNRMAVVAAPMVVEMADVGLVVAAMVVDMALVVAVAVMMMALAATILRGTILGAMASVFAALATSSAARPTSTAVAGKISTATPRTCRRTQRLA